MRVAQVLAAVGLGAVLVAAGGLWAQGDGSGGGAGAGGEQGPPKNLKVLPKEMTRKEVNVLMKQFNKALGVKCQFCHNTRDYASDENKHKDIARHFMRMTVDMQKNYFNWDKAPDLTYNCYVCHQGQAEPRLAPP